jgi:DNA-binding beta-propeller fold protein YncE
MRIGPSWLLTALAPMVALAGLGLAVRLPAPAAAEDATPLRRPVAVALTDGGRSLLVANRSGSVSIIDPEKRAVVVEKPVGRQLANLAVLPDGRLLAVDERASELVLLSAKLERLYRLPVATTRRRSSPRSGDGSSASWRSTRRPCA